MLLAPSLVSRSQRLCTAPLCESQRRFSSAVRRRQRATPLPAAFIRGGTSKGVFIARHHLPDERSQWTPMFLSLMGSPDAEYGRQLDGLGGGVSSLSKIVVVGKPSSTASLLADVEYTFAQVGIRDDVIDYSGNCGNLSSMVGPFAIFAGLIENPRVVRNGDLSAATVRTLNTNTNKIIDCTFPVSPEDHRQPLLHLPQTSISGVPGEASRITLDFIDPAGARTGQLLPSGTPIDQLSVNWVKTSRLPGGNISIETSLVDATNPTVFVDSNQLAAKLAVSHHSEIDYTSSETTSLLEHIRQQGARHMSLDPHAQAQPKIAVLSTPDVDGKLDIVAHAISMGVLHRAIPMTVGLCLGVAAHIPGTIPWRIVQSARMRRCTTASDDDKLVRIGHPSGMVEVGADVEVRGDDARVRSAKVVRTGRRLMDGVVWW